ncbi:MAG: hypothetical protein K0Q49_1569 [Haloplasmataceae bacterium]|jgi:hypothetical protein|nr:hypothetical protein [Haloplasmataceae bacterium]
MSLAVKVIPILDSRAVDITRFENVKVYDEKIENEAPKPFTPPCFLGAWYRKFVSSNDLWIGIEGVIELGEFTPDKSRFNLDGRGRFMDNPSIYMGGKAALESDCGLNLNLSYFDGDTSKKLDYSSPKLAWRPFWRYIFNEADDIEGNVTRRNVNSWNVTDPTNLQFYYFPGDVIRMSVYSPLPDYLQLRIEVIEPSKIEKYMTIRKKYNIKNDRPADFYSPIFHSKGHGCNQKAEFKRVNSIDQYGNEGYKAAMTNATVSKSTWSEVYLYREINGEVVKVPFTESRASSMICPNELAITVSHDGLNKELGAEYIEIHPAKSNV